MHPSSFFHLQACYVYTPLYGCLKPWKGSYFTLLMNLRTPFQLAPKGLYSMSSFWSSAMLQVIKIIYSIFLLNSSFSPWIHWISSKNCEQVTMSSSTSLFAGGNCHTPHYCMQNHQVQLMASSLLADNQ